MLVDFFDFPLFDETVRIEEPKDEDRRVQDVEELNEQAPFCHFVFYSLHVDAWLLEGHGDPNSHGRSVVNGGDDGDE